MLDYYKENIQLYFVLIVWFLTGYFAGPIAYIVIPFSIILMLRKSMYEELIIGYFFILILSDNINDHLAFARNIKLIYIIFLTIFLLLKNKEFTPFNRFYKIFIPFFIFSLCTIMLSLGEDFFAVGIQKTLSFVIFFLVIPNYLIKAFREEGEQFIKRYLFFIFTTLILGLILKLAVPNIVSMAGRYKGIMQNPNGFGIYCLLFYILFFITNDFFPNLFSKVEKNTLYVAILFSIILSGSRNALIAMLIFYFLQYFFRISPFLGFIIFLIVVFLTEFISSNLSSILLKLGLGGFLRVNTLENGSGRYVAWAFAWKEIQNNFFVGKGYGYDEYYMFLHFEELSKKGHQGGVHNSFLTFWMDQGLIGLLLYIRSYILVFIKAARNTRFAFPIMFAITFTALFESWLAGSLSAYGFLGMFIFTFISNEEITQKAVNINESPNQEKVEILI